MPSLTEITVAQLSRIIGLPGAPMLLDVRSCDERGPAPQVLPTARRLTPRAVSTWAGAYSGRRVVVYCRNGGSLSQGTAAWLRQAGIDAQTLEGGFEAWCKADHMLVRLDRLPERNEAVLSQGARYRTYL